MFAAQYLGPNVSIEPPYNQNDSFFELGGHSLKVALMVSRIEREFLAATVDQVAFYRRPTITFGVDDDMPVAQLRRCIEMALTYHRDKKPAARPARGATRTRRA